MPCDTSPQVRRHKRFAQQNLGAGRIHFARACQITLGAECRIAARSPKKTTCRNMSSFLVRPTGFEPAAFRVGVIRRSNVKLLRRSRFSDSAQIRTANTEKPRAVARQRLPVISSIFQNSSQTVVRCSTRPVVPSVLLPHQCSPELPL